MRIALIGQAAFGEKVLEALLKEGEQVSVVYCPPDAPNGKKDSLGEVAEKSGIPLRKPARMRNPEVFEDYNTFDPDLNVMAFVTDFVPMSMIQYPKLGTIQYHPSLLPYHRGGSAINWAVINGEPKTGISIFWPDEGLDTGPILMQKEATIGPDETMGQLYFNKLFPMGVESMVKSVNLVREGKAPKIEQELARGEYEPLCKKMEINWMYPIGVVYSVIRGCNPSPGASTLFRGTPLRIFDCDKRNVSGQKAPGTVLDISEEGFLVAGNGGSIFVKRVQPQGSPKVKAAEFAAAVGLQVGDKLG